jgi:hypothetical protein
MATPSVSELVLTARPVETVAEYRTCQEIPQRA